MLQKRWKICTMLFIIILSDVSDSANGKNLQPRHTSEKKTDTESKSGTRVLLSFASLADATNPSGVVFCVANPSADPTAVSDGLNWACGPGSANCIPIQPGQPCYVANNLTALASYAYNDYYQRTRASGGSCDFNKTAMTTLNDPSFGSCIFKGSTGPSPSPNTSTSPSPSSSLFPGGFVPPPPGTGTGSFVPVNDNASESLVLRMAFLLPMIMCHFFWMI
ncbi:glucan endo-1,3-beta-glucosidase 4-like isoform X1 [Canna indica]|uniref:Glucan endo-1,3-beta-glucosidase 4-like isoform X1 n=1 Tax=Canna indica TaxID=4628 RepID=A0AAQ3JP04_9LILI|nr:glucan endo-1,3-beta-glucosidase 4-like isoform X1 [Canna indica]